MSKVLANRLKCILGEIISPKQSAFVLGRLISYNTILAYEMTHFLKRKITGVASFAALKIDMSKAYDRVQLGFSREFVALIRNCMSTVQFRF